MATGQEEKEQPELKEYTACLCWSSFLIPSTLLAVLRGDVTHMLHDANA